METISPKKTSTIAATPSPLKTILSAWLTAGTMDISMAIIVWAFLLQKVTAEQICRGIASGIFGSEAFSGGGIMIVYGVLFHFIIVFCFTVGYFLAFPYIPFLRKYKLISGLLYGVFAWVWMTYVILPIFHVHQAPFKLSSALISISILMVCIGTPISLIVSKYYERRKAPS